MSNPTTPTPIVLIVVRLLPSSPIDADSFTSYLQGLTVTAYDRTVLNAQSPNPLTGTKDFFLGQASLPPASVPTPPFAVIPGTGANSIPSLSFSIIQHIAPPTNPLGPLQLKSVATAVIIANLPSDAPSPYPEYPTPYAYDVTLDIQRGGLSLPDPPMEWNINAYVVSELSPFFTDYMGIAAWDLLIPDSAYKQMAVPSLYAYIPPPPPSTPPTNTAQVTLDSTGDPPNFDALITAVDLVLATYNLTNIPSLEGATIALTSAQCDEIAAEIIVDRSLIPLPPIYPPFPAPSTPPVLEDLYTSTNSTNDGIRKQFEAALSSYHATNDANAKKLSPYIFAAAAAIYAEIQTTQATSASFTFPVDSRIATTNPTATVIVSTPTAPLNPSFVVPAAYFYALAATYPAQLDAAHRYQATLTTTADSLTKSFQTAINNGVLNATESTRTLKTAVSMNAAQAVQRLSSLSAGVVGGPEPELPLSGSVSSLADQWLQNSTFWTTTVFDSTDYLNLILQTATAPTTPPAAGTSPVVDTGLISLITSTPLVPSATDPNTLVVITKASDLPQITNTAWQNLFAGGTPAGSNSQYLPSYTLPGSTTQRVNAFITNIQKLFSVGFAAGSPQITASGSISGNDFSADVLSTFIAEYPSTPAGSFSFQGKLDENTIASTLQNAFPGDHGTQKWVHNAIETLNTLVNVTSLPSITQTLQFSYMEALYSRGIVSLNDILSLSVPEFTSVLAGTVAYQDAGNIYTLAGTQLPSTGTVPGSGFQPCNPGSLVNCVPPPNLSPLGPIEYLYELLQLSSGQLNLAAAVEARRGPIQNLIASRANLDVNILSLDLAMESLESLGSNLSVTQGAINNTSPSSLETILPDVVHNSEELEELLVAVPQYSSPAVLAVTPTVYSTLETCFTSPELPYSQSLDVCRTYICALGSSRFDTMRCFRRDITEFPLDAVNEPVDFQRECWRLPIRFDIALEYTGISNAEYTALWAAPLTAASIAQLYGTTSDSVQGWTNSILTLPAFLAATGLTYCEFLELSRCGFVKFGRRDSDFGFPECPPCCMDTLVLEFTTDAPLRPLTELIIFIRLWQKLQQRCYGRLSFVRLADICNVLGLFLLSPTFGINPDFLRQFVALLILQERFALPWTDNTVSSSATGAERTKLLAIWVSPVIDQTALTWATETLLSGVHSYAEKNFSCEPRGPRFRKVLADNLDRLSSLAGFSSNIPWSAKPTCTIRFMEVLGKLCASRFTVGEIIFLFTAAHHLDGDDPFPLGDLSESLNRPLNLPEDEYYNLSKLREKLLCVEICEQEVESWGWDQIESIIKDIGFVPDTKSTGGSDALISLAEHFFPHILEHHGHHVPHEKRRFTANLSSSSTTPQMWSAPPCEPFHFESGSGEEESGTLWIELPLLDEDVFRKLRDARQLSNAEIAVVKNLYFAPRAALAPFALLFSNFNHAVEKLIKERDEKERYAFFRRQVAKFHRRCEIIAEHLAEHVSSTVQCDDDKWGNEAKVETAWEVLKSLIADENSAATAWEVDSGQPPTSFTWNPKFSGNAFAALLGLVGTGLLGQIDAESGSHWKEISGGMKAFGHESDVWNAPVPTLIPSLDMLPTTSQMDLVSFKNGFAFRDENGEELGGAQPFQVTWHGSLLIDKSGHYRFLAGHPDLLDELKEHEKSEGGPSQWLVKLKRGQRSWNLLNNGWTGEPAPAHISLPLNLHEGVYTVHIQFCQVEPKFLDRDTLHRIHTGFEVKYEGPDTNGCFVEIPHFRLLCDSKTGLLGAGIDIQGVPSQFLDFQYISTLRDIRRTYQRAFKATLFSLRFRLSARKEHCDHQSELGFMLDNPDRFLGTSYYTPTGTTTFQSHHAYFDFNLLPVRDPYISPTASTDSRVDPSPQRQAAFFDMWERVFDYTHLRELVEDVRKRPLWLLFQEVKSQQPQNVQQLVRLLGVDIDLASLVLNYYAAPIYQISPQDLLDERWAIRIWHAREWIKSLAYHFSTDILSTAIPELWAADDPSVVIGATSGNKNLVTFVQQCLLTDKATPRSFDDLRSLNNKLREHGRQKLLTYLCTMNRVQLPTSSYATQPRDLTDLLLQDVEVGLDEKTARIDDALHSIQTFVQRARIGLEPGFPITYEFSKLWENRYASFDCWVAWKRRSIYHENWIKWDEQQELQKFEGTRFLKQQLREITSTIVVPGRPMWWADGEYPGTSMVETIQTREMASLAIQQGSTPDGLSLMGQPMRDARPSWLAADIVIPSTTTTTTPSASAQTKLLTQSSGSVAASPASTDLSKTVKSTAESKSKAKTSSISIRALDQSALGTLEVIPLWIEAAIRLGTSFIRVAAAGIPPAFPYKSMPKGKSPCCKTCGRFHDDVVDEYYFWLQTSNWFDASDVTQDATVGAASAIDPYTSWEDVSSTSQLPSMLAWSAKPLYHLFWTRVHMGRLDPPRRSDEGVPFDIGITPPASPTTTPFLTFNGRSLDSLFFTAVTPITTTSPGFRYDMITDTAVVTPQIIPDTPPTPTLPAPLDAYPTFIYFTPGKPLVPLSSFSTALTIAGTLRSNCQYEPALKWCQIAFDPLQRNNTWAQCPTQSNTDNSTISRSAPIANASSSVGSISGAVLTPRTSSESFPQTKNGVEHDASKPATIPTPSTFQIETKHGNELDIAPRSGQDLPCCPSSPVPASISRSRAVTLEYVEIILEWADHLSCKNSIEASQQAIALYNAIDRILGPRPMKVEAHDSILSSNTIANFVPLSAPLNPRLLKLYDQVVDRKARIHDAENARRLHNGLQHHESARWGTHRRWDGAEQLVCDRVMDCFSCCQPYRFSSLLSRALECVSMTKGLGASLLAAYEKGDAEYLAALRATQERQILDLGLQSSQNQWRATDWDVQALDQAMEGALTRLRYYQGLIQNGLSAGEVAHVVVTEVAMETQSGATAAEATAQGANIIPDLAIGVAGEGPYQATSIPIGIKMAKAAQSAGRIMTIIAQVSSSTAGLALTQAQWARRPQEWQNQVDVITAEIQQIKRQTLASWRRRDIALRDLNNHQQQMEHAAEVQDFMRDKFTKQELDLFLQQETAALYRQSYDLAVTVARQAQDAFWYERADIHRNFLSEPMWDSLHEGLLAGERLELALRSIEHAYMDLNCREYELTKHMSLRLHFPKSFLLLKSSGHCEIGIPEWMFDLDYPGHYLRRIKSVTLSIPCVTGPYTGVHCRLQLLSSSIRIHPLLQELESCCCKEKKKKCYGPDPYVARRFSGTEAIATSSGQDDSGLFQLNFQDERYLPFEFSGAVSRWRIELPPENNLFDFDTLTDVIMHVNYTAREGGQQLRDKANECAQVHPPGDGIRFFDIRHDFSDTWSVFKSPVGNDLAQKFRKWPLRFSRGMFPFLTGRRSITINHIHLFLLIADACPGKHLDVKILGGDSRDHCKERHFRCVVQEENPRLYHGRIDVKFGPIGGYSREDFGFFCFPHDIGRVQEAYLLCDYEVESVHKRCEKCCLPIFKNKPILPSPVSVPKRTLA